MAGRTVFTLRTPVCTVTKQTVQLVSHSRKVCVSLAGFRKMSFLNKTRGAYRDVRLELKPAFPRLVVISQLTLRLLMLYIWSAYS